MIAPAFFTRLSGVHRALPWVALGAIDCLAIVAVRLLEPTLMTAARRVAAAEAARSAEIPRSR